MKEHIKIEDPYDSKAFRKIGHELIDVLANHLEAVQTGAHSVYPHKNPNKELEFWQNDFNDELSHPLSLFKTIIAHSTQLQHPKYIGHQSASPAPITSLVALMVDFLNNGTGVFEMGPASNAMERIITDFTAKKVGYHASASGLLTSGGTLANLTALLAARREKAPSAIWQNGHKENLAVMVSEEAHYCIDRSARILGLGDKGIIKVPVDKAFKIRPDLLQKHLEEAKSKGLHVFCIVGCAGSTATGSYDDLNALAKFSKTNNLWFHVDGAHGGAVVFSKTHKKLVSGIEKADSIAIDFHKMLMTPALNTALLFKRGSDIYKTFAQKAQYLWDTPETEEWYNSAKKTFECTKRFLSANAYVILKTYGKDIFEKNIDALHESTQILTKLVLEHPKFELAVLPESNIVNFRFIPHSNLNELELNNLNLQIRKELVESGQFYIVQTTIKGKRYLRCTIMNPLTSNADFVELIHTIEKIGLTLYDVLIK